jgi:4-carboxymuconolactone decarboxylase
MDTARGTAEKAGIAPATIADLRRVNARRNERRRGARLSFLKELHDTKTVGDATFKAARRKIRRAGRDDLAAVSGYYTMLAMILGVAGNPVPVKVTAPLKIR